MSSRQRVRSAHYEKLTASASELPFLAKNSRETRDRKGMNFTSDSTVRPATIAADPPPSWFLNYMLNFKNEIISDLLTALETHFEDREKHMQRSYRKSYFVLKARLNKLEDQGAARFDSAMNRTLENHWEAQSHSKSAGHSVLASTTPQELSKRSKFVKYSQKESESPNNPYRHQQKSKKEAKDGLKGKKINDASKNSQRKEDNVEIFEKIPARTESNKNAPQDCGNLEENLKNSSAPLQNLQIPETFEVTAEKVSENSEKQQKIEVVLVKLDHPIAKNMRSILNTLTSSNLPTLLEQLKSLNIKTEVEKNEVINQFFEKATNDPIYSTTYALLCKQFVLLQPNILRLRKLILSKCEAELEEHKQLDELRAKKLQEITTTVDKISKENLGAELKQMNPEKANKFMGYILFIGELYNQDLLSNKFLHKIIQHLLQNAEETDIEHLCKLLRISGKNFEFRGEDTTSYYVKLSKISLLPDLSATVKLMIGNLIEIKDRGWDAKRIDEAGDSQVIFSFAKALDDACASKNDFLATFYHEIQPQFNLLKSTNFTRDLLNSAIERGGLRTEYFEVFRRSKDNKIAEWIGGEEAFIDIVLQEMKLFFASIKEFGEDVPEVWQCLRQLVGRIVEDWGVDLSLDTILEALQGIGEPKEVKEWLTNTVEKLEPKNKDDNFLLAALAAENKQEAAKQQDGEKEAGNEKKNDTDNMS